MYKMSLEGLYLRIAILIGRCQKPLRAWSSAGRYRHAAFSAVRAKAAGVLAKSQDGTLGIQTHPLHLGLFVFFLLTVLQGVSSLV
jgi:hypothetical protein